jgi:hypothetical protein
MSQEQKAQDFRIHLIYRADGMTRPLSYRNVVAAKTVRDAVWFVTEFIKSAYASGFQVISWSAENLSRPVSLTYVYREGDNGTSNNTD